MKNNFKISTTVSTRLFSILKSIILLSLLFLGIAKKSFGQSEFICPEDEFTFTGTPQTTLCEAYENLTCSIQIGAGTAIANSSQIGSNLSGNVCITGDFTVNNFFTLTNTTVKINPGVKITVATGNALTMYNTVIFACDGLWKGITLESNTVIHTNEYSHIEDAEKAISANSLSALWIQNTTFNRNRVGIYLERIPNFYSPGPMVWGYYDVTMSCDAPLNGTTNEISFAGVQLKHAYFYSNSTLGQNTFTRLQNGIYAEGEATLGISNFTFDNLKNDGIYLESAYLTAENCIFNQCQKRGIDAYSIRKLRITKSAFHYNMGGDLGTIEFDGLGIYGQNYALNSNVFISECDFDFQESNTISNSMCIYLKAGAVETGTSINIFNNDFTYTANFGNCIRIEGNFSNAASLRIELNNFLDCKISQHLIRINDGDKNNLAIVNNTIDGNNISNNPFNSPDFVIRLEGSNGQGNEVSTNTFVQDLSTIHDIANGRGVRSSFFHNTTFCENHFSACPGAMYFENINLGTQILSNAFIGGSIMLQLNGIIGEQGIEDGDHNGNTWLRKFQGIQPYRHADCISGNCNFSRIFVHTQQTTSSTTVPVYYPENVYPVTDWFTVDLEGSPIETCANQLTGDNTPELLFTTIADGQLNEEAGTNWEATRYLYRKLEEEPSLISQYTAFSTFHSGHANSPIGKFYEVAQSISEAFEDSVSLSRMQGYNDQRTVVENEIKTVDSLLRLNGFNSELKAQKEELLSELLTIDSISAIVFSGYHSNVMTNLQAVVTQNQQITTTQIYENNEKVVNNIFLNSFVSQEGNFADGQIDTLLKIALQCPQEGGMAVYRARGILPECVRSEYEETFQSCFPVDSIEERSSGGTVLSESNSGKLNLYPNPVFNEIHVPLAKNMGGVLTIVDSFGRKALQRYIAKGDTLFSIPLSFPAGIYYCSILWEDSSSQTEPFIVR